MSNPYLSIITPTYNRGHLLIICYESLLRQTDLDFEWIVVDDGSMDRSADIAEAFDTALFPITVIRKENGGKHTALNAAHLYIHGKYVLILDSDDLLTEDAVSSIREAWDRWESYSDVGIVTFLKGSAFDNPNCEVSDYDTPVDILRYRRTVHYGSDCCEVIRSELFLKYPFPEYAGERFISECALWNRVSLTHKCVYINKVIYLFEYLEGGLTKSGRKLRISNPRGGMYICDLRMHPKNYLIQRLKYGLLYCCYGFFAGCSAGKILVQMRYKMLTAFCLCPGYVLYRFWKRKYGN
ncbi:MAG: glycosyltransferase family 2 protein [Oscillospiraceae bacterium]|nr:glycosyltransferase family 2 protein [Oscillospiraceae bacterium]